MPHEAWPSPTAVVTLGTGGSGGDGGRARRELRGLAVCTAVRAPSVTNSSDPMASAVSYGDDLMTSSNHLFMHAADSYATFFTNYDIWYKYLWNFL